MGRSSYCSDSGPGATSPCSPGDFSNKWAGGLPLRGAGSREALAGLRLPETRPQGPKNRLRVTASARAGGREAGPGPPRQGLRPAAGSGGDSPTPPRPRDPAPHPHCAPRRRSARPPALPGRSGRQGPETEAGAGAAPRLRPACNSAAAPVLPGTSCRGAPPRGRGGRRGPGGRRAARRVPAMVSAGRRRLPQPQVGGRETPGGSAAGEEARREWRARPGRSYSGRHVAAHAAGARRHPLPHPPPAGPRPPRRPCARAPRGTCPGPRAAHARARGGARGWWHRKLPKQPRAATSTNKQTPDRCRDTNSEELLECNVKLNSTFWLVFCTWNSASAPGGVCQCCHAAWCGFGRKTEGTPQGRVSRLGASAATRCARRVSCSHTLSDVGGTPIFYRWGH